VVIVFSPPAERTELEQILPVNVFDVEFVTGFGEVVQGRRVGRQRLRFLCECRFFKVVGDSGGN
jgi:hypothetical protein